MSRRRRRAKAQKQLSKTHRRLRGFGSSVVPPPKAPPPDRDAQARARPHSARRMALALGARRVLRAVRRFMRFSLAFGLIVGVLTGVAATGVGIYYYQNVASDLPEVTLIRKHKPSLVSRVFDQSGSLLREFYVEKRFLVTLDKIPDVVIQAILATEDARFEDHPGVDLVGIGRAAIKNLFDWGVVEGGSTITQQLA